MSATTPVLRVAAGLALAAGALLPFGGAATSPVDDDTVRPFAEVQASEFVFEADPADPTRGIFRVTTTEPMICAIVWGETEAFGNFNNSLAMSGTGIVEHDVFLPGAVPGETYFFRVQGSTADGTLYQSETGTFTIPERPASAPDTAAASARGDNLAVGAEVVDVSSEFGDGWEAVNAIDGDGATEWATAGDGDDAFLAVDLGAPTDIAGVEWITRSMADGSAIVETFTVTVDDGEPLGPFDAATAATANVVEIEATGQVVRFDVATSTGGNVGAVELAVYG